MSSTEYLSADEVKVQPDNLEIQILVLGEYHVLLETL